MKGNYTVYPSGIVDGSDADYPQMKGNYTAPASMLRLLCDADYPQMKGNYTVLLVGWCISRDKTIPK